MNVFSKLAVRAAVPAVAVIAALGGAAAAQASTTHYAGSCTARGQYATCVAGGNAYHPSTIYVHVHTNASQWIKVYWDVVCSKGTGAGSRSGHFSVWDKAGTSVRHAISHPYSRPASCSVSSDAQLSKGSYLHVWNTYHRWY